MQCELEQTFRQSANNEQKDSERCSAGDCCGLSSPDVCKKGADD
jgi:hypothetical protein